MPVGLHVIGGIELGPSGGARVSCRSMSPSSISAKTYQDANNAFVYTDPSIVQFYTLVLYIPRRYKRY